MPAPALAAAVFGLPELAVFSGGPWPLPRPPPRTTAGIRVLRDPKHQIIEPNAEVSRLLGGERGGRHSGLGVHLQQDQNVVNVVITEVASGNAATTKRGVGELGHALGLARRSRSGIGPARRGGAALPVLGVVVVEAGARHDLGDGERLAVHHRDRQLQAADIGLDHHLLAEGPGRPRQLLRRRVGALEHQEHADRGALGVRLDHIGRRHDVVARAASKRLNRPPPGTARRPRPSPPWTWPCPSPAPRPARPQWV